MPINTNDKYYTPEWLVKKVYDVVQSQLKDFTITEIIEPSAGNGAFIEELDWLGELRECPVFYYDLYPEHPRIIKQDYLKLNIPYKAGRVIIGNPPFGDKGKLWKQFLNKSAEIADYVVFILPASQLDNNSVFKRGNLKYSQMLNSVEFSGVHNVEVKTCLNIYEIGANIQESKKQIVDQDFTIESIDRVNDITKYQYNNLYWTKDLNNINADIYLCNFGHPFITTTDKKQLYRVSYLAITIHNEVMREDIMDFITNYWTRYQKWYMDRKAGPLGISQYQLRDFYLLRYYPELKLAA